MRIAIGSDHRGVDSRLRLVGLLERLGNTVVDCGSHGGNPVDYPDVAADVAERVASGDADRGILLCCTGVGMAIAANKVEGIRAALALDELSAQLSRSHNDANVLCMSADLLGQTLVKRIVDVWMRTEYEAGRHARRLAKISRIERGEDPSA